jgi:1-acyl-sn-glycerol-3-phosphate acyltransferase
MRFWSSVFTAKHHEERLSRRRFARSKEDAMLAPVRLDRDVHHRIDRLELPFNALGLDPYGISKAHLRVSLTALAAFYRWYFSVKTHGIEHVPPRGRAMLVGNHSGGIAIDAAMVLVSCLLEMEPPRLAQGMAERFIDRVPFANEWAARTGQFTGLPEHAERLLDDDRLLMVFPEGARGTAKLYRERYSLVDFGSGFVRLALKTHTPIIPFAVLGGGEAFPTVANGYRLGKLLGVPYVPIVAYGLPVPLPAKIEIHYGAPMRFAGTGNEDDEIVFGYVDKVKEAIAGMLATGARRRRGEAPQLRGAS